MARRLRELSEAPVVVHDSWAEDPAGGLIASVRAECGELGPTAGLVDTIAAAAQHGGELHLLLDQFEEYLLDHGAEGPLSLALPELLRRPGLRVNVLLAIRDDALSELDEFTGRIPELFGNLLRLDRLDRAEGRVAILGPLARYSELSGERFTAEEALVEAVLDEASTETGVEAAYLQLVLERLWERERDACSHELQLSTLRAIGGARAVVREHVHGALEQLTAAEQEAAARVVRQLVTPSGRKLSHEAGDLAEYADVEPPQLRDLLEQLGRRRIVRGVNGTPGAPTRYEIFHDVLGPPLLAWQHEHQLRQEIDRAGTPATPPASDRRGNRPGPPRGRRGRRLRPDPAERRAHPGAARARARARGARALADIPTNPQTSVQLALHAAELAPGSETTSVLRASLLAMRDEKILRLGGSIITAAFAPRGEHPDDREQQRETRPRRRLRQPDHETAAPARPDGRRLEPRRNLFATGAANGKAEIWRVGATTPLRTIPTTSSITTLSFDRTTLRVASGTHVRLVDRDRPDEDVRFPGAIVAAALDPTGDVFAVAMCDGKTTTPRSSPLEPGAGSPPSTRPGSALSPSAPTASCSRAAATTSRRASGTRAPVACSTSCRTRATSSPSSFSPDGRSLVTSSSDGGAYLWDVATGERELLLIGATGAIQAAALSPDGSEIATASADRLARIDDSQDDRSLARPPATTKL